MSQIRVSIIIPVDKKFQMTTEVSAMLRDSDFVEEIILVGEYPIDCLDEVLERVKRVTRISLAEHQTESAGIKAGIREVGSYITAIVIKPNRVSGSELQHALASWNENEIIAGISENKRRNLIFKLIDSILIAVISKIINIKIWDLDPDFYLLQTDIIRKAYKILPDDDDFFLMLLAISNRKGLKLKYIANNGGRNLNHASPSVALISLYYLLYWGVFFNPNRVFLPLGLLCTALGIAASVQRTSINGTLTIIIGVASILLSVVSEVLARRILSDAMPVVE